MNERFIFEVLKKDKVICEFTSNMSVSDELKEIIINNEVKIQERAVSEEFYQELVDDGGLIKYDE